MTTIYWSGRSWSEIIISPQKIFGVPNVARARSGHGGPSSHQRPVLVGTPCSGLAADCGETRGCDHLVTSWHVTILPLNNKQDNNITSHKKRKATARKDKQVFFFTWFDNAALKKLVVESSMLWVEKVYSFRISDWEIDTGCSEYIIYSEDPTAHSHVHKKIWSENSTSKLQKSKQGN